MPKTQHPSALVDAGEQTIDWNGEPGDFAFAPKLIITLGKLVAENPEATSVTLHPNYSAGFPAVEITIRASDAVGDVEVRYLMAGKGIVEL